MQHMGTKRLETERLVLRPFRTEDSEAMYRNWASDPEVTKFLTWPPHADVSASAKVLAEWAEKYSDKSWYQWAIVLKGGPDEPIGSISVVEPIDERIQKAHVGYCIGRSWWRQGITTEALRRVVRFLFDEVGVNKAESRHDPRNPNSGAVMRKSGLKYEGTLRRCDWNAQGLSDACYYGLLAEER